MSVVIASSHEDYTGDTFDVGYKDEERLIVEGMATRVFDVVFDSGCSAPAAASSLAAAASPNPVPMLGEAHPTEPWLFVSKLNPVRVQPQMVKVTVQYTSIEDPLNQSPVWEWGILESQEPIDRDKSDNPIDNSAGEPFDPPITTDVVDLVLRYSRNEATFDPVIAQSYINAVNTTTFLGFAPGKAKCKKRVGRPARYASGFYYPVEMEFHFRTKDTFARKFLDAGFRDSDGKLFVDTNGKPLNQPIKLNGSGEKLRDGADPVFLTFDIKKEANLNDLNIVLA